MRSAAASPLTRTPTATAELPRPLGRDVDAEPVERESLGLLSEADADRVIAAKLRTR